VCDAREEKKSFVGSIVVRRTRTHTERETDWPKPKISTSSHVGISITSRPCVFCVVVHLQAFKIILCATQRPARWISGAHSEPKLLSHKAKREPRCYLRHHLQGIFIRMRVYFALQSMLRRRMPSGHTASEKTQDRAQLPALFYCGARAIKCVYEAN
jgi:hypothetical protein